MADHQRRVAELDGVRAVSILLVLATHLLPVGPGSWQLNAATGLMGMSLFFCLSGFLITTFLWEDGNVGKFFKRRLARILPLLYLYAVIVALIVDQRGDTFAAIVFAYLNYADAATTANGISHLWSICVEMHFYILIGLSVLFFGRRGLWAIPLLLIAVMAFKLAENTPVSIRSHLRMDEILVGGLVAIAWANRDRLPAMRAVALPVFLVALPLWLLSCHSIGGPLMYVRPYFAAALVSGLLFMDENLLRQAARLRVFGYLARVSYALYIWHPLMALGWLGTGGGLERYLVKRPITFALTFLVAHVSTHTYEAYFQGWARRARSGRSNGNAAAKVEG